MDSLKRTEETTRQFGGKVVKFVAGLGCIPSLEELTKNCEH